MELAIADNQEPTPEQEAEILGETIEKEPAAPADEKPAEKSEEEAGKPSAPLETVKKDERSETPPPKTGETKPPEGETPPAQVYTKDQVDGLVKDRLGRFSRELQTENQQLRVRLESLEKVKSQSPAVAIEQRDLGGLLKDPRWNGWTVNSLKEAGHEDSVVYAMGRLEEIQRSEDIRKAESEKAASEEQAKQYDAQVIQLVKADASYGDATGSVKGSAKFAELVEWGAQNGVYNLLAAHVLKNIEGQKTRWEKEAVEKYLKETTGKQPLQRASGTGDVVAQKSIGDMDDKALQEAYLTASSDQETAIEAEMKKRGIF